MFFRNAKKKPEGEWDPRVFAYSPKSEGYYDLFNKEHYNKDDKSKTVETNNDSHSCSPKQPTQEDEAKSNLVCSI